MSRAPIVGWFLTLPLLLLIPSELPAQDGDDGPPTNPGDPPAYVYYNDKGTFVLDGYSGNKADYIFNGKVFHDRMDFERRTRITFRQGGYEDGWRYVSQSGNFYYFFGDERYHEVHPAKPNFHMYYSYDGKHWKRWKTPSGTFRKKP